MSEFLAERIRQVMADENDQIERDLGILLGPRTKWPKWVIRRLGYEVVYQHPPYGVFAQRYRGVRRRGKWLVDHQPSWPQPFDMKPKPTFTWEQ